MFLIVIKGMGTGQFVSRVPETGGVVSLAVECGIFGDGVGITYLIIQ
jgi:hypothetical protein